MTKAMKCVGFQVVELGDDDNFVEYAHQNSIEEKIDNQLPAF